MSPSPWAKLNAAMVEALADPGVRKRLEDLGQDITPPDQQTAAALGAHHKAEIEKWWRPINLRSLGLDSRSLDEAPAFAHDALAGVWNHDPALNLARG